jgi:hypothetical protein
MDRTLTPGYNIEIANYSILLFLAFSTIVVTPDPDELEVLALDDHREMAFYVANQRFKHNLAKRYLTKLALWLGCFWMLWLVFQKWLAVCRLDYLVWCLC